MSKERITQINYEKGLSHYGSSLGVYEVLKEIEKVKKPEDIIVLDEAHGALGYYVWLEELGIANAEELFEKHGVHQNRDVDNQIWVSGGSLGNAGAISLGMAIAKPEHDVYVIISDGGFKEGVWAETFRAARDLRITNWKPYINYNGYGGYSKIDSLDLEHEVKALAGFGFPVTIIETHVDGLQDHYRKVTKEEYENRF